MLFAGLGFRGRAAASVLLLRGPNGAGKTTLLLTLAGIVRPDAGQVELPRRRTSARRAHLHLLGHADRRSSRG